LYERSVEAVVQPRHGDGAVTVEDQNRPGCRLKIPSWMLSPAASRLKLADQACIRPRALRVVADLLRELLQDGDHTVGEEYAQASVSNDGNTEGCDEATRARLRKRAGHGKHGSARSGDSGPARDADGEGHSGRRRRRPRGGTRGEG
jgi:hypothetical protein